MLETVKELLCHQFDAALCTLGLCIESCPDAGWNAGVGNLAFCQVAFHTLFYTDFYLGPNEESFRRQPFHVANRDFFRDYEEFEDRAPVLLCERAAVKTYLNHCRGKEAEVISRETAESLEASCGFARRNMSRAELYIYNIRHIQHHAAQLSLRLRLDAGESIPWVESGWRDM